MERVALLVVGFGLLPPACGGDADPSPVDAGDASAADAGGLDAGRAECVEGLVLEEGHPDGHPAPLPVPAGQARAGRLAAAELPEDPTGLGLWEAGDFVLANEHVALVVEDVGASDGLDPWGGRPVALSRVEGGRLVDAVDLGELAPALGRFGFRTDSVTVLADGADGGAAVVRAAGAAAPYPFFEVIGEGIFREDWSDLRLALDWSLAPGDHAITVRWVVVHARPVETRARNPLVFTFQQNRLSMSMPGVGHEVGVGATAPFVAFASDSGTGFAWQAVGGDLVNTAGISNFVFYRHPQFVLPPCEVTAHDLARIHVAGPGLDAVALAVAEAEGEGRRPVTGVVRDAAGAPAAGVRVHVEDPATGSYLTRAETGEDGRFLLHVPGESPVRLTTARRGDLPATVTTAGASAELALPPTGTIEVRAFDEGGAPLPVRVQTVPDAPAEAPPASFGEIGEGAGRMHVVYPPDGHATLRVPVGRHRVIVSHGYERELHSEDVDVAAGAVASVTATLPRVVDTPGVMCGDFHLHTHRSFDTEDPVALKLRAAAAEGLEIPVRSDHEWVGTFEPDIVALGLEDRLFGIGSLELTTFVYGHFGVFPLAPDPTSPNLGAIDWVGREAPAVFADARARVGPDGPATVMMNHPRSGTAFLGYFSAVGYDPDTGTVAVPDRWSDEWTLLEAFNDSDFDDNLDGTVRDWFSFLRQGRRVFTVGASDSHQVRANPVGYPRTCVEVGVDSTAELRDLGAGFVVGQMLEGRHTVVGGAYVEATARGGVGPGGEVIAAGTRERVRVRVQAPSWVAVDTLRVFVDGALVETVPLDDETGDPSLPVRFDQELSVSVPGADSWVVFVVSGETDLAPVHPGRRPFAVTNPIFFR